MDDSVDFEEIDQMLLSMYEEYSIGEPWYVLEGFSDRFLSDFKDINDPFIRRYLAKMDELELIEYYSTNPLSSYTRKITRKGIEVVKAGGWKMYVAEKLAKDKEERDLRLRELLAAEASAKSGNSSAKATWAATIVAVISILWAIYQTVQTQEQKQNNKVIKAELDTLRAKSILPENEKNKIL